MRKLLTHFFWILSVAYGKVFGRTWLAGPHQVMLNLSLHGLGYDNCRGFSYTGEGWFITHLLKKHTQEVYLDIGANVGGYTRELVTRTASTVYAIEPSLSSFTALQKASKEFPGRIIPLQTAISDFDGVTSLFSSGPLSETATLEKSLLHEPQLCEEIPVCTVDTLVRKLSLQHIDFIKIDTEGYEREVIQGMKETLVTLQPKFIAFEFNILQLYRGYTVFEMAKLLPHYDLYRLLPNGMLRVHPEKFRDNIYMFSNLVAIRRDPL